MANTDLGQKRQGTNTSILSGELAHKIAKGNRGAEGEFVELNYRWLLFVVRRKFSRSNNHEDIVQDAFMLVITKLKQGAVKKPEAILGFLRTAAIQIGFDYLRKDKKFTSDIDPELIDTFKDASDDILSTLIWNDKLYFVKQVIDELKKPRDKDVLIKFYFHDIDKPTICAEHDLKSAHFDRVIFRARERLKKLISEHGGYDEPTDSPSKDQSSKGQLKSVDVPHRGDKKSVTDNKRMMSRLYHSAIKALQKLINPVLRKTA